MLRNHASIAETEIYFFLRLLIMVSEEPPIKIIMIAIQVVEVNLSPPSLDTSIIMVL
ncbi:hypothetical protein D3C74_47040 [compost metagenome]